MPQMRQTPFRGSCSAQRAEFARQAWQSRPEPASPPSSSHGGNAKGSTTLDRYSGSNLCDDNSDSSSPSWNLARDLASLHLRLHLVSCAPPHGHENKQSTITNINVHTRPLALSITTITGPSSSHPRKQPITTTPTRPVRSTSTIIRLNAICNFSAAGTTQQTDDSKRRLVLQKGPDKHTNMSKKSRGYY